MFLDLRARIAARPSALRVVRERALDADVLLRVDLLACTGPVPPGDGTVLLCRLLELLPDEDAVLPLMETAAALAPTCRSATSRTTAGPPPAGAHPAGRTPVIASSRRKRSTLSTRAQRRGGAGGRGISRPCSRHCRTTAS
ncbi:hypothetical protein ACIRO3_06240 [Streptomyces sp. NPDC102278]|uniref:hypothetical protein n=1 Tax=Streptomyces sp. NPDC102278 TaxID=3366152 RepID=UPI00382CD9EC